MYPNYFCKPLSTISTVYSPPIYCKLFIIEDDLITNWGGMSWVDCTTPYFSCTLAKLLLFLWVHALQFKYNSFFFAMRNNL